MGLLLALLALPALAAAQPNIDASLGTDEYGPGNSNCTSAPNGVGTTTWCITWDATYLYGYVGGARLNEPGVLYLDINPAVPVNGGTGAATDGLGYDGITHNLPFSGDVRLYFKDDYREIRTGGFGTNNTFFGSGSDNTSDYTAEFYDANDNSNGYGSDDRREFKVAWSDITGGAAPAALNFFGFIQYGSSGSLRGIYAQFPTENPAPSDNPGGNLSVDFVRYQTVTSVGASPAQSPFTNNSYTYTGGTGTVSFGGISVYDFTLNTSGVTISRSGGAWTIGRNLVVSDGQVDFNSITDGTGTANLYAINTGLLRFQDATQPLTVTGVVYTLAAGTSLIQLGTVATADLALQPGAVLAACRSNSVTTQNGGGQVVLTSDATSFATTAKPGSYGCGASAGGVGVQNNDLVYERFYDGASGWRFLGAPLLTTVGAGQPFSTLNDDFHTQGATGADFTTGTPNLYSFDQDGASLDGQERDRYVAVADYSTTATQGDGYAFYAFASAASGTLPTRYDVTGQEQTSSITRSFTSALGATSSATTSAFYLAANPFAGYLDWEAVVDNGQTSNLSTTISAWDPNAGRYRTYTAVSGGGTGTDTDGIRYLTPGQGFFVQNGGTPAVASSVTFRQDEKTDGVPGGVTVVSKRETAGGLAGLTLHLTGQALEATPVRLSFDAASRDDADLYDATWLPSLAPAYATLWAQRGADRLFGDARPMPRAAVTFPLGLDVTAAGAYTLGADLAALPEGWTATLRDTLTGQLADLRARPYTFFAGVGVSDRFTLTVAPTGATAVEPLPGSGAEVSALYPSPAKARTGLTVRVGTVQPVRADLYDVLGRHVQTVFVGTLAPEAPGVISVETGTLASGTYVLRVTGTYFAETRTVVVAR